MRLPLRDVPQVPARAARRGPPVRLRPHRSGADYEPLFLDMRGARWIEPGATRRRDRRPVRGLGVLVRGADRRPRAARYALAVGSPNRGPARGARRGSPDRLAASPASASWTRASRPRSSRSPSQDGTRTTSRPRSPKRGSTARPASASTRGTTSRARASPRASGCRRTTTTPARRRTGWSRPLRTSPHRCRAPVGRRGFRPAAARAGATVTGVNHLPRTRPRPARGRSPPQPARSSRPRAHLRASTRSRKRPTAMPWRRAFPSAVASVEPGTTRASV